MALQAEVLSAWAEDYLCLVTTSELALRDNALLFMISRLAVPHARPLETLNATIISQKENAWNK